MFRSLLLTAAVLVLVGVGVGVAGKAFSTADAACVERKSGDSPMAPFVQMLEQVIGVRKGCP
jgi:hypothetical protein